MIDRRDLVAALDRAARKAVTIISAPAGSGKTTLLKSWIAGLGRSRRVVFTTVRPGQQDAQLFWLTLLGAAGGSAEPAPGFDGGAMVDRVREQLGAPAVLVIDDLHELGSTEALSQLTMLLTTLPHEVNAILATRRDPPLRLHQLRLAGELAELRAAQLRFTEAETREFLTASGIVLTDRSVAELHRRTEGWAAGLRLAALSLAGHPDPERFVAAFSGSERTVAEYLVAEMLERQPADVQRLLLRTSLLDRVNGELADLLTGASGSERILLELEDANAFVVSLDPERTWFRYHHLFGSLLRLELRRTSPGETGSLHRISARWLTTHGQIVEAVGHLQAAGDWPEAARLLADHAFSLTLNGQAGTVRTLLAAFPDRTDEALALVFAISDLDQLRLAEAAARLEIARPYAAPPAIASLELLLARLRGDFATMLGHVAPAKAETGADVALGGDLRVLALLNLGVAEAWSLRLAESRRHLREGAALARELGRPYLEVACLAQLGFASMVPSPAVAKQRCEEAIALAGQYGWAERPVIAPALATLAGIMIWRGEFGEGEQWLDRALCATRSGSEPGLRLLLHLIAGMLHAGRGRHGEALEEFDAAIGVQAGMTGEHALSVRVIAWNIATRARLGLPGEAPAVPDGEIRNAAAVIRLTEGDPRGAREALRQVLNGEAPVKHVLTLIEAHLLDALAHHDLGDQRAVREAVERALDLAEPERLILPFAMTGAWELLESLPPHGTSHAALVADILDAVRGIAPAPRPVEELSPSELRVLRFLPTNLTRPEIAQELTVSLNTVNTHLRRIYAKLGVTDRSGAVRRGRELRLLTGSWR
ncbi:LuxR C-terminal-related transcriptional regulator [Nonomuraea sp. NPDC001699]